MSAKGLVYRSSLLLVLGGIATNGLAAGDFETFVKPLVAAKCGRCHGGEEVYGEVDLKEINTARQFLERPDLIKEMIEVIEANDMPPEGEPQLDEDIRTKLLATLKTMLREAASASQTHRIQIRRLNRFQYNNSVRDLFQLNRDVFPLPEKLMTRHGNYLHPPSGKMPERVNVACHCLNPQAGLAGANAFPKDLRASHGFDNQANQLTLSPLLLDAFLRLSVSILESPDFNEQNVGVWNDFFKEPAEDYDKRAAIQSRLEPFLEMAFRGPVDGETVDRYTIYAASKMDQGLSFTESMKKVASAVLCSPMFLYRSGSADGALDPFDLASDLSFCLWGSCPDRELLRLAESGELSRPDSLNKTIERMFADPKIERFLDTFPSQWMQLENVLAATPDPEKYRLFSLDKTTPASLQMVLEPLLLFDAVFIEDRPIVELISPAFSYQSDFLKAWYTADLKPPQVDTRKIVEKDAQQRFEDELRGRLRSQTFERVAASDPRFGGVITNAAMLSMTSGPKRTKPIARGAWIIEVIFNDPPPPPPNNVPPLDEDAANKNMTIRETFAEHRKNPSCAGCHARIDPLGFALENFDVVGRWRNNYENGREVDASGMLMKKHSFQDVVDFKKALVIEQWRFARAFAGHLLRFASSRELTAADSVTLDVIVEKTEADDFKLRSVIKEVLLSLVPAQ